jgi:hypothetical protein
VALAFVVAVTMSRYGMLGYSAPIHVAHHPSLLPFTPFEVSWRVTPATFQTILVYALVFWVGVTGSWTSKPRPERAPHPGLVTLMLSPLGGVMTSNLDMADDAILWVGFVLVFFTLGLPLMAAATAWRFRRPDARRERVVRWGVVLALLAATQLHNDRQTPRVGATLAERDAWAREHMGEPYTRVVADLESAPLLARLMGDDVRVAPITPDNGWLSLDHGRSTTLRGWLVVDDGARAARCYVYVRFGEGEREHLTDVTCYRAGVELAFDPDDPDDYALDLEVTRDGIIKGAEYVPRVFPDLVAAFHEVSATSHGLVGVTPELQYARVWTQDEGIHVKAMSYVGSGPGTLRCRGYLSFDLDGARRAEVALDAEGEPRPAPACAPVDE